MENRFDYKDRYREIVKTLAKVALMIGDTVSDERIIMTAKILDKEIPDDDKLVLAFDTAILRDKRFPSPSTFIEYAGTSLKARAQDALEKIFKAVKVYRSGDPSGARRFIGEAGWRTLESCGGWNHFCTQQNLNVEVFRSQFINSFVDRVPFMESSGEIKQEFIGSSPEVKKLVNHALGIERGKS
jgi:hypothetical protein